MRKTILVVVLAFVVAGVVALIVASNRLQRDAAATVAAVEQQLRDSTGLVIDSPRVSVEVYPPALVFTGGRIRAKGPADRAIAEGGTIIVTGRSGLTGDFVPRSIELRGVHFTLRPDLAASAVVLFSVLRTATLPVVLSDCTVQFERPTGIPPFEATRINVSFTPGSTVAFGGTAALLGTSSHAELKGEWRPGAGRTGGDGLQFELHVRHADPEALGRMLPDVRLSELRGSASFDVTADGFVGERTTESMPGEPLKGHVHAETDMELFGLRHPAVFDSGWVLDDRRWVLDDGQGRWGDRPFTYSGWIARGFDSNKVNLRAELKDVSVGDVLAEYGIAERWRPHAVVSGDVRMGGTLAEPLTRYDAKLQDARFDGFPGLPVSTGPVSVSGSLLAVNAEASGSFEIERLAIGKLAFEHMLVGVSWWRGKLNVTTLNQPYWDGKLDAAGSYEPSQSSDGSGGGMLHNVDAKALLAAFFPGVDPGVEGRLDASVQGGYGAQGLWYEGRFDLRRGALARGLVRTVADRAVAAAGVAPSLNDALVAAHVTLDPSRTSLANMKGAFSARSTPIDFQIADSDVGEAVVRAAGTIDAEARVDASGLVTLKAPLLAALAHNAPALGKLAGADGTLPVPFRAKGRVDDFTIELDPSFTAAVEKARGAEVVEPFAAPPAPEPLDLSMPPLEEQLGE